MDAQRMMLRMMDGVLGSICRDAFPGLAEVEANYVSPGPAQEAFFEAVDACNIEAVRKCLKEGGFDVGARNKSGWTAMHCACLKNGKDIAKLLLEAKATVDARNKPFEETPLHIAVIHCRTEIVKMLLDRGASPFSLDCYGNSVLSKAQEPSHVADENAMAKIRKMLEEKANQAKPLEQTKKREDGCGACGKTGVKLLQCARCHIQYYCSPECQKGDWRLHKPRCSQAKGVLDTIKTLGDQSASISAREAAILQLAAQKELVKKMKCLKAILDIVPTDKEVHQRSPVNIPDLYNRPQLPSLLALHRLLAESRTVNGQLLNGLWDQKDLWEQLIDLNGIEIILKRLLKGDLSTYVLDQGFQFASCPFGISPSAPVLARRVLARGFGPKIVEVLGPALSINKVARQQTGQIISRLVMEEGHIRKKQKGTSSGTPQGLGPVAEVMFRTTDLRYLADAARADHVFGEGGANQGALTFFAAVTRNRPEVLEHLVNSHRQTALVVVDAYARGPFYDGEAAWSVSLEFLSKALNHSPNFAEGIFSEVMRTWEPELVNAESNEFGLTRKGFCDRVIEFLDVEQFKETSEMFEFPDPKGGPVRNWENAANICLHLIENCPLLRKYWDLKLMSDLREQNPNPTVKEAMRQAERILARHRENERRARRSKGRR